jgi:hypothetical protein
MLFSGVLQRARHFPNHNQLKAITVTLIFLIFWSSRRDHRQAYPPRVEPQHPDTFGGKQFGVKTPLARAFTGGDRHDRYGHCAGFAEKWPRGGLPGEASSRGAVNAS